MAASAPLRDEVFAGNRAVGRIALSVAACAGVSRRTNVHEAGSLRVRFPNRDSCGTLDAVVINTAGGMTGGDRFDIDVKVHAGARLVVTTAAAEKIYRSLGPDTEIAVKINVDAGGSLTWLPQETILFDQARMRRSIDVELAPDANLVLAETIIFGRSAMGEAVSSGHVSDRWRVRVGDRLVFAETMRLEGKIAQRLEKPAIANGSVAVASLIKIPGNDDDVAAIRDIRQDFVGEVGASAWNGLALIRFVAPQGAALRQDIVRALTALVGRSLPRLWLN